MSFLLQPWVLEISQFCNIPQLHTINIWKHIF